MHDKLRDEAMDELFRGILSLQSVDECYAFFEDLCTISELKALEQRFLVARLLREGLAYQEIVKTTGASTATISRVNRSLQYGEDGYKTVLSRIYGK